MNTIAEMMKVWVEWDNDSEVVLPDQVTIPEMDYDAVPDYLSKRHGFGVKHWDLIEECGDCGHAATKTMWDRGKVDCCHHCSGCDSNKPYSKDWTYDDDGDLCPDCQNTA